MGIAPTQQELAAIAGDFEKLMLNQAKWLAWTEGLDDGYGGRKDGWLATPDPRTNQPTIPISIYRVKGNELQDLGGELTRLRPSYIGRVPLRVPVKSRDRLDVDDGYVYEVLELLDFPNMALQSNLALSRV